MVEILEFYIALFLFHLSFLEIFLSAYAHCDDMVWFIIIDENSYIWDILKYYFLLFTQLASVMEKCYLLFGQVKTVTIEQQNKKFQNTSFYQVWMFSGLSCSEGNPENRNKGT